MRHMFKILIIALGMTVATAGIALAADVTVEASAGITGTAKCEIDITSGSLSLNPAPTGVGASTTTFSGSPIQMTVLDNTVTTSTAFLLVKISSSPPEQYGTANSYIIRLAPATFTASVDSMITEDRVTTAIPSWNYIGLSTGDATVATCSSCGGSNGVETLHGSFSQAASLYINASKRLYGDTSDSITITYTLVDS